MIRRAQLYCNSQNLFLIKDNSKYRVSSDMVIREICRNFADPENIGKNTETSYWIQEVLKICLATFSLPLNSQSNSVKLSSLSFGCTTTMMLQEHSATLISIPDDVSTDDPLQSRGGSKQVYLHDSWLKWIRLTWVGLRKGLLSSYNLTFFVCHEQ